NGEWTLLAEGITPSPAQPRRPKSKARAAFVPANDRYASVEPWPAAVAASQGDHDMQGYRFVSVRVNPLAYVGAEKKLYLREKVTVTVSYDEAIAVRAISSKQAAAFGPLVDSLVVNPEAATEYAPKGRTSAPRAGEVDYLIITSAGLSNAFQRIADYRASASGGGYTTRVLTTNYIGTAFSGVDIQAKIRACISNAVATWGTEMVLLGGDDTVVLDRNCYAYVPDDYEPSYEYEMPTDLYYSGLSGSWNSDGDANFGETNDAVDLAWDVVVARLPMRTAAQVTNYLNKVMAYESGSPVTNKIILGGPSAWDTYTGTDRPSDDVTIDGHAGFLSTSPAHTSVSDSEAWLRRLYRDGIYSNWPATVGIICDTITSWDGSTCGDYLESSANTISAFNKNWTHLMFSGHGEPQAWGLESGEFNQSNASGMTGLVAFVYTDACMTGHFDKNSNTIDGYPYTTEPCLAEGFLRNTRTLGGALAHMGCSRYGWGDPDAAPADNTANGGPSTVYAYKFYQRMYETTNRTLGVAFAMHKADMISLSGTDDCERWIQFGMNLLGDPALKMPSAIPLPSAPAFTSGTGPYAATTGVEKAFTVTASGNPAPVLALQGTTASSGYGFVPATGVLTYAPPVADAGTTKTFTFTATNTLGAATQTVSVSVTLAPPPAPAAIWASATNAADFTAAWSSVSGATGYRLDVGTNDTFTGGGGASVQSVLASNAATSPSTLTDGWSGYALGGTTYIQMTNAGAVITSAVFSTVGFTNLTVDFRARTYGGTAKSNITVSISGDNGENWTVIGIMYPPSGSTMATVPTLTNTANLGYSQTRIRWQALDASGGVGVGVSNLVVKGWSGGGSPSYVQGYSNRTVAGTSQGVTGLVAETIYYFRARAVNGTGAGPDSPVASVETLAAGASPSPQPISIVSMPTNGTPISIQINTVSGITYALQYTLDLIATNWVTVEPPQLSVGDPLLLQDADATATQKFYRVAKPD
ncbi:MAG TPA: hypothetical protein DCM68_04655, partial [Verrucomicrobia bacterium]|nr:hypothetical protein [Verrucomicrobiota bacterium]